MRSKSFQSGFSLLEILIVIGITALLAALMYPTFGKLRANAHLAGCQSGLRTIGIAAASYATDHDNEWPYYNEYRWPEDQQAWLTNRIRTGSVWTGLGKTYPYHQDKVAHFCPAGSPEALVPMTKADWRVNGSGSINGTHLVRGYGQTNPRPLGKTYASLERIALAACTFAYAANNPVRLPLGWHKGVYPVLFTDGSIQTIRFPDHLIDPANPPDIWNSNTRQIQVWDYFDGRRTTLSF